MPSKVQQEPTVTHPIRLITPTVGVDIGDHLCRVCLIDERQTIREELDLATTKEAYLDFPRVLISGSCAGFVLRT